MIVKDRVDLLKRTDFAVYHKALGDEKLMSDDWVRIWSENREPIFTCDRKDIGDIPSELLGKTIKFEEVWVIGGYLAFDMFI